MITILRKVIKSMIEIEKKITHSDGKYIDELPPAEPITVLQLQRTLGWHVRVDIKPNNHKTYWSGDAVFIPKDFYDCRIIDISLRKRNEEEDPPIGGMGIFIDPIEKYEAIADKAELDEINHEYRFGCRKHIDK